VRDISNPRVKPRSKYFHIRENGEEIFHLWEKDKSNGHKLADDSGAALGIFFAQ
jgi:hypothetical protein